MTKEQVRQIILETRIVPVVRASSEQLALAAAEAVTAGGIPIVEITMTVPCAIDAIATLSRTMGDRILIGAGTVLDAGTAQECLDAGAHFLVSPGFDAETVKLANHTGTLIMAGALTPTEVITAWKAGSDFVKIFPAGNVGGPSYIKALKAALPQIPMIPTGGVNLNTAAAFLEAGACALGIGGELISGDAASITARAKQYLALINPATDSPR